MRTRTAALLAAALVTSIAAPHAAHADAARAWKAAKDNLPSDTTALVGFNVVTIRKSQLFATVYPLLIAQKPEIQQALDLAKSTCKVDPIEAVDGAVMGTDGAPSNAAGAVYIALHNLDQAKLISCFEAISKAKGNASTKVTTVKDGNITELSIAGAPDKTYVGWIGTDVMVIAFDAKTKSSLQKWMGGKGALAKSSAGKPTGKINTAAAGWAVVVKDQDVADGIKMKAGYGSVDLAGGNVAADVHLQVTSPAEATKASTGWNKQLSDMLGKVPANMATMLKSVKIGTAGDEVTFKANATETDILSLMATFMGAAAGGGHP